MEWGPLHRPMSRRPAELTDQDYFLSPLKLFLLEQPFFECRVFPVILAALLVRSSIGPSRLRQLPSADVVLQWRGRCLPGVRGTTCIPRRRRLCDSISVPLEGNYCGNRLIATDKDLICAFLVQILVPNLGNLVRAGIDFPSMIDLAAAFYNFDFVAGFGIHRNFDIRRVGRTSSRRENVNHGRNFATVHCNNQRSENHRFYSCFDSPPSSNHLVFPPICQFKFLFYKFPHFEFLVYLEMFVFLTWLLCQVFIPPQIKILKKNQKKETYNPGKSSFNCLGIYLLCFC